MRWSLSGSSITNSMIASLPGYNRSLRRTWPVARSPNSASCVCWPRRQLTDSPLRKPVRSRHFSPSPLGARALANYRWPPGQARERQWCGPRNSGREYYRFVSDSEIVNICPWQYRFQEIHNMPSLELPIPAPEYFCERFPHPESSLALDPGEHSSAGLRHLRRLSCEFRPRLGTIIGIAVGQIPGLM